MLLHLPANEPVAGERADKAGGEIAKDLAFPKPVPNRPFPKLADAHGETGKSAPRPNGWFRDAGQHGGMA